jgi:hypothetical protein
MHNLQDSEKEAKARVPLPYTEAQQKNAGPSIDSTQTRIRVGGQIVYEADAGDDFDDEDPDEDLSI